LEWPKHKRRKKIRERKEKENNMTCEREGEKKGREKRGRGLKECGNEEKN